MTFTTQVEIDWNSPPDNIEIEYGEERGFARGFSKAYLCPRHLQEQVTNLDHRTDRFYFRYLLVTHIRKVEGQIQCSICKSRS